MTIQPCDGLTPHFARVAVADTRIDHAAEILAPVVRLVQAPLKGVYYAHLVGRGAAVRAPGQGHKIRRTNVCI